MSDSDNDGHGRTPGDRERNRGRAPGTHEGSGRSEEPGSPRTHREQTEPAASPGAGSGAEAGSGARAEAGAGRVPVAGPAGLGRRSWKAVLRRTVREFKEDELSDRAAALTYYAVLSVFPALLLLVSVLGILGADFVDALLSNVSKFAPGSVRDILTDAVSQLRDSSSTASVLAVVGLLGALWSASNYVAAFIRTSNVVYDLPEGRPAWKLTPVRVGLTVLLMVMLAVSTVLVVFTGPLATQAGDALGLGGTALTAWNYAKWPFLLLLVALMIALLYWGAPNVKGRGLRWVTPGSALAVLVWLAASAGFAVYVANFASYNKTYGTLAGVIIFLVWLWITNLAILLGLEFDAELARQRAISGGHPSREEPYVAPRDTRRWPESGVRRPEAGPGENGPEKGGPEEGGPEEDGPRRAA
ncbi:YihY/virulence factor BrkB family protein [Streptomyces sp. HNM0575]|uniref:YihY/virulence factor BrkB family protein n=1 Tax=Streptomyces sp. HNM0575 TaxID=2716338 RepID=UPI00145CEB61|nr:YihY/virulence factor BrkB family protein [Streptomyces sp. HNM0575]NLU75140.1 YihY/virulence factor BrkB family protein [Streptomyces sp. HNM0575]